MGIFASFRGSYKILRNLQCKWLRPPPPPFVTGLPLRPLGFSSLRPSMDAAELKKLLEENQKATLAVAVCHVLLCAFILRA